LCISPLPENSPYLALSYVWGGVQQPKLLKDCFSAWSREGGLPGTALPRTIRDAISLTSQLGQRYLWVDSLCIINDDDEDRTAQIENMHFIYHQAWLTIVAAAGDDANAGLPGLPPDNPRKYRQITGTAHGVKVARVDIWDHIDLEDSAWNSRGWTLQEKLCSRRTLIVTECIMNFQCAATLWREDIHREPKSVATNPTHPIRFTFSPITVGLREWGYHTLVMMYLARKLSDPNDILNAFSGIIYWITPSLGKFHHGFPINDLWKYLPWHLGGPHERRSGFPSWSWAGWQWGPRREFEFYWSTNTLELLHIFVPSLLKLEPAAPPAVDWEPELDSLLALVSETYSESQIRRHFEPDIDLLRERVKFLEQNSVDTSQLIAFFTSSAMLDIELVGKPVTKREKQSLYCLKEPTTQKKLGSIILDPLWISQRPSPQEFIVVSYVSKSSNAGPIIYDEDLDRTRPCFRLMLIERSGEIAYRVSTSSAVSVDEWWESKRQRKLIFLG
jgi:hypothetical protein